MVPQDHSLLLIDRSLNLRYGDDIVPSNKTVSCDDQYV